MALTSKVAEAGMRWIGHEVWNVGIVDQSAADIVQRGITEPVRWLPNGPPWTFVADPFALPSKEGGWDLFAERMDYWKTKGSIWSGKVGPSQSAPWVNLRPTLEMAAHMSFPFAFSYAGVPFLLCETWEAGGASLYAHRDGHWQFETVICPLGRNPIDAVLFEHGDFWWLFCSHPAGGSQSELYLYYAAGLGDAWQEHPANPIVRDVSRARMAGPIVRSELGFIRPGQDCSITYGGGVQLNRIIVLDRERYVEESIRRLSPIAPYAHGLHTVCPIGDRTIIDGKAWRFHPLDLPRKVYSWRVKKARREALRKSPAAHVTALKSP